MIGFNGPTLVTIGFNTPSTLLDVSDLLKLNCCDTICVSLSEVSVLLFNFRLDHNQYPSIADTITARNGCHDSTRIVLLRS
jgi:hypothetical protein